MIKFFIQKLEFKYLIWKCERWYRKCLKVEKEIEKQKEITIEEVLNCIELGITSTGQSDSYCVGFCNALIWLKSCITHEEPQFFMDKRGNENEVD